MTMRYQSKGVQGTYVINFQVLEERSSEASPKFRHLWKEEGETDIEGTIKGNVYDSIKLTTKYSTQTYSTALVNEFTIMPMHVMCSPHACNGHRHGDIAMCKWLTV